jgi:hypothetical protein
MRRGVPVHDVGGFAILVGGLILGLWMLVQGVLPLVSTWLAGTVAFFLVAVVLLRGGRRCPEHLPSLLKPGVAWLLLAAALGLPALHGALLALSEENEAWPWVLAGNLLAPMAFTSRALARHALESRRFVREGHDVAAVLDGVTARVVALGVLADRLAMAAAARTAPEPWEAVAGDAIGITEIPLGDVETLDRRVEALRAPLVQVAESLGTLLGQIRDGSAPALPHPALAGCRERLAPLEAEAAALSRDVDLCLGESRGRPLSSWVP